MLFFDTYFLVKLSRLKLFREVVAARVPYYRQQILPHSNLLDPHFRSQFAGFLGIGEKRAQVSRLQGYPRYCIFLADVRVSTRDY